MKHSLNAVNKIAHGTTSFAEPLVMFLLSLRHYLAYGERCSTGYHSGSETFLNVIVPFCIFNPPFLVIISRKFSNL